MQKIYRDTALAALFFVVMGAIGYFAAPYLQGERFAEVSRYAAIGLIILFIARVLNVSVVERLIPTKVYVLACGLLPFFGCATAALAPIGSVERDFMWFGMAGILLLTAMYPVSIHMSLKKVPPKSKVSSTDNSANRPRQTREALTLINGETLAEVLSGQAEEPQWTLTLTENGEISKAFCLHDSEPLDIEKSGNIAIATCPKCKEIFTNVIRGEEGFEVKPQLFTMRAIPPG